MSELNTVSKSLLVLYPGDDTPFWYVPDVSNDVSGLDPSLWTVVIGFYPGRVPLGKIIHQASIQFPMTWNPIVPTPLPPRFEALLSRAALLGMAPGPWTGGIWRTNSGAQQLLLELETTVVPTVYVTTTSSTTTTTTTT